MSWTANLLNNDWKFSFPNGFVIMFATCFDSRIELMIIFPSEILSRTKWQLISMCCVRSWTTRLAAMLSEASLSRKRLCNQVNLQQTAAMERYSEERETTFYSLLFQQFKESPKKRQESVVDLWVIEDLSQISIAISF